jgi:hypothetical protein
LKDGWRLSTDPTEKLDQEEQDRLARLKSWLAKQMRRVKLPDLLIEVDNQLGFTLNFLTPAQREEPSPEDICAVLAAVMAHGCNLGVYTMAQLTSNVTYEQLLEHVSPIEWDNVVLYGQYILDRKLVRRRRGAKRVVLSV